MINYTGGNSLFKLTLSLLLLASASSCNLFDRTEPEPAYVYIPGFNLSTPPDNSEGSSANDIVDAWVYSGGTLVGVFELPAMVPILDNGIKVITLIPGIKNNGRSNNRISYPFYTSFKDSMNLIPGHIDTIAPDISYYDGLEFSWLEDFEDRSISLEKSGNDVTEDSIQLTTDPSLIYNDGFNKVSAFVELDTGNQYFENSSIQKFDLPRNAALYLEINYKLDVNLQIGITAIDAGNNEIAKIPVLQLFKTEGEWQKTYVSLAEDINTTGLENAKFKLFFAAKSTGDSKKRIYFDNIKLVHF